MNQEENNILIIHDQEIPFTDQDVNCLYEEIHANKHQKIAIIGAGHSMSRSQYIQQMALMISADNLPVFPIVTTEITLEMREQHVYERFPYRVESALPMSNQKNTYVKKKDRFKPSLKEHNSFNKYTTKRK